MWGGLVKVAMAAFPGSTAFRLGMLSALCGILSVVFFAYCVSRYLWSAIEDAEDAANILDLKYEIVVTLGILFAIFGFAFAPGVFFGFTRMSGQSTALLFPLTALMLLSVMSIIVRDPPLGYFTIAVGFFATLGAFESGFGIIMFVVALCILWLGAIRGEMRVSTTTGLFVIGVTAGIFFALGDDLSFIHFKRLLLELFKTLPGSLMFDGMIPFVLTVLIPTVLLRKLITTRWLRTRDSRRVYFIIWGVMLLISTAVTFLRHPTTYGKGCDEFVERAMANLDQRKWIVSDGILDYMIEIKKPADAHLVSLRRELDPRHGEEILEWTKSSIASNDDICVAAELGPSKFLREWIGSDPAAITNCLVVSLTEPKYFGGSINLIPNVYSWESAYRLGADVPVEGLADHWQQEWNEFKTITAREGEPGKEFLKHCFSIQGNAIGAMACAAKERNLAWDMFIRVVDDVGRENLSAIVNMVGMMDAGYEVHEIEQQRIREKFRTLMGIIRNQDHLQYALSLGGRLFVDSAVHEQIAKWGEEARKSVWDTPFGKQFKDALEELEGLNFMQSDERAATIKKMESTTVPELEASQGAEWVKRLFLGEFYTQKGGTDALKLARENFRRVLKEGKGEVKLAFDRLLMVDVVIGEYQELEYDALLVLRYDIRHQLANALLGSARLETGNFESAERFLRRAINLGKPMPSMRNDLALALSGLGRYAEAEKIIRGVIAECPKDWNARESLSQILFAAGRETEAAETLAQAKKIAMESGDTDRLNMVLQLEERKREALKDHETEGE